MAVNMSEAVQKGMEALVNCTVCTEPFKQPKVLPCQHTFCLGCLHQFYDCYNQQRIIKMTNFPCPACRKIVYLSGGGLDALPDDFKVGQIREFLKNVGIASKSRMDICDICKYDKKQKDAQSFCVQCSKYLCTDCLVHHQQNALFSTHSVMDIASNDVSVLECKEHNEEIKYYCVPCSLALCTVCALGRHSKHDTIDVTAALDQKRHAIEDLVNNARQQTQQFEQKAQELAAMKINCETHYTNTQAAIKKHAEEMVDSIHSQERKLLKQLETSHKDTLKLIKQDADVTKGQSAEMVKWIDSATDLLNPSKSLQLLAAQEQLMEKMKNISETQLPCATDKVTEGSTFKPGTVANIGKLQEVALQPEQTQDNNTTQTEAIPSDHQEQCNPQVLEKEERIEPVEDVLQRTETVVQTTSSPATPSTGPRTSASSLDAPPPRSLVPSSGGEVLGQRSNVPSPIDTSSHRTSLSSNGLATPRRRPVNPTSEISPRRPTPLSPRTPLSPLPSPGPEGSKRGPLTRSTSMRDINTRSPTAKELKAGAALKRSGRKIILQRSQPVRHTPKLMWRTEEYCCTRDVAFTQDGCIATAEHEETSDRVELFESCGELRKWMNSGSCAVVKPWGITANHFTNTLIVTDHGDSSVKVLDQDLNVTNVWRLHFSKPCGIAVMRTGDYVVTDIGDRAFKVTIHTSIGLRVKEFGPNGASDGHLLRPQYVAVDHHDRILVSDCDGNCIKIFDRNGQQLNKFTSTNDNGLNMYPQGICVDTSNNILVADQSYSGVSMYSPNGKFIQHIIKVDNIPWGLAVNEGGMMAIGTDPSLRLYSVPTLITSTS